MQSFFKSKARIYTVVGITLILQFCCCILPVGWQMQKENPAIRQTVTRIESRLNQLPVVSAWIDGR